MHSQLLAERGDLRTNASQANNAEGFTGQIEAHSRLPQTLPDRAIFLGNAMRDG
jgi:hypothetical protein